MLYEAVLFGLGMVTGWFYSRLYDLQDNSYSYYPPYKNYPTTPPPSTVGSSIELTSLDDIIQDTESLEGASLDFLLLESHKKDN